MENITVLILATLIFLGMSLSKEVSQEQLNYFRVCHLVAKIIPEKVRIVFKQEWDRRYGSSHGNWDDSSENGNDFYSLTTLGEKKRKKKELTVIKDGNTEDWDCTCLFYAILFSDCIGNKGLDPTVKKSIDTLRLFRNNFAHVSDDTIAEDVFQSSVQDVITALEELKCDVLIVRDLMNEKTFSTDELCEIKAQLDREKRRNREIPTFCVLPPMPCHVLTEREKEVSEIYNEIIKLREANKDKVTVTYLTGNPGCGKSELARQIGQKYFDEVEEDSIVMTLDASSIDSLWLSYNEFVRCLECDDTSINQIVSMQKENKEKLAYLQKKLMNPTLHKYSSWLIIVDNVNDLKMVSKYIPHIGQQGNGHVVFTIQDTKSIPPPTAFSNHFQLSKGMQQDDAVKTLQTISKVKSNKHIMDRVSKALNYQPLALACAAMWMQAAVLCDSSTTWTTYLHKVFEGSLQKMESVYEDVSAHYNKPMTTAIKRALDVKVAASDIMKYAFQFLSVIAMERIPMKFIVNYVKIHLPNEDHISIELEIRSSSLIITSEKESDVMVQIHQCVHLVLSQDTFRNETRDLSFWLNIVKVLACTNVPADMTHSRTSLTLHIAIVVYHINVYFNDHKFTNRLTAHYQEMSDGLFEVIKTIETSLHNQSNNYFLQSCLQQFSLSEQISVLLVVSTVMLAVFLRKQGQCILAKNLLEHVLPMANSVDSTFKVFVLSCASTIFTELGNYEYAKELSEDVLEISERKMDAFCYFLSRPQVFNNIGVVLKDLGEYKQSKKFYIAALRHERMVDVVTNVLRYFCDIPTRKDAITLSNLGLTLKELGEYDQAQDVLNKAIEIKKSNVLEDRDSLAAALRIRALVSKDLGKYFQAKADLEIAIEIQENKEKEYDTNTNPWLARMWRDLASVLQDLGQYTEAKDLLEKAQDIEETINHPNLASTLSSLASVLIDLGKYDQAQSLLKRALDIQEKVFKNGHPNIAITLHILALLLQKLGKYNQAKSRLEKAIEIQKKTFDKNHPSLAITEAMHASVLHDLGQHSEAKEQLKAVLVVQETILDKEHPSVAITLCTYASVIQDLGEHQEAIALLERATSIQEKAFKSEDHPCLAVTLTSLASNYKDFGDLIKAKSLLKKALAIQEKTFDKDHPDIANTLEIFASALHDTNQYNDAREHLERALEIEEKAFDNNHPILALTLSNLALVLQKLGDLDKAKELLDKTLAIEKTTCTGNHPSWANTLHNLIQVLQGFGRDKEAKSLLRRVAQKGASWD